MALGILVQHAVSATFDAMDLLYRGQTFEVAMLSRFALYALSRIALEGCGAPDAGLEHLWWGLTMGQTLSVPMLLGGVYLIATAKGRRVRVEPIAGSASVA